MSTIYTFHRELPALLTPATTDRILTADVSTDTGAGATSKDLTLALAKTASRGPAATDLVGFYGATPVDQGTMTATALSALSSAGAVFSASTGAGVFGFASSTVAIAYVTRVRQMQADIDTLMGKINSTGFVNITGL